MIHKSQTFNLILQTAFDNDVTLAVMGGYPRDLALGRVPRDLDICVYNTTTRDWHRFSTALESMGIASLISGNSASCSGDNRVYEVLKTTNPSVSIDIICWNEEYKTLADIAGCFDFNINQWALLHTTDLEGTHTEVEAKPVFLGDYKNFGTATLVRNGELVSPERHEHMRCVALMLGWEEPLPYVGCCPKATPEPSKDNTQPTI